MVKIINTFLQLTQQQPTQPLEAVSNGPNLQNGLAAVEVNEVIAAPVVPEVTQVASEASNSSANSSEEVLREVGPLEPDMFGLYSLSFYNKTLIFHTKSALEMILISRCTP